MVKTVQEIAAESISETTEATETLWITDELVAATQDVWCRHLNRPVTRREAVEMLLNVQSPAMAFHMAETESESPE